MSVDLTGAIFKKSRRSGDNGCVEVAVNLASVVAVRDSKNPAGPALSFAVTSWSDFMAGVKAGSFDL